MADKQRKIELLAPAGNWERFVTAIQFGADAVYLGAKNFNARRTGAFNLLPIPPLDGAQMLASAAQLRAQKKSARNDCST